jgi:hypothetical protein
MNDGDLTWDEVRTVLAVEPNLTAREIRLRLERRGRSGLMRKDVNRVLYRTRRGGHVTSSDDDTPRWTLAGAVSVEPRRGEPDTPPRRKRSRTERARPVPDDQENVHLLFDVLG